MLRLLVKPSKCAPLTPNNVHRLRLQVLVHLRLIWQLLTTPPSPPPAKKCEFCGKTGHLQPQCYAYIASKKAYPSGHSKPKEQQASHVSEFVGTAAVRLLPPSHPLYHKQLTAQLVADTGASSTMIPYRS